MRISRRSLPVRAVAAAMYRDRGERVMRRLARETGGEYFEVSETQPIEKTYAEIEDLLRNQYSIGYTPQMPGTPGQFHKVKLMAKRPELLVQTPGGYYAKQVQR